MDEHDATDKAIVDLLTLLFDGDVDRIQAWLEFPHAFFDGARPIDWWEGGKRAELVRYLQGALGRRGEQPLSPDL